VAVGRAALAVDAEPGRPYVVEVDRLGEAKGGDRRSRDSGRPIRRSHGSSARFISDVRSVSLDPVLMRQNWLSAYDFATKRGAVFLGDYARTADPFGHVGERRSRCR
jgi:type IV secretory pathway TrbF-like protein